MELSQENEGFSEPLSGIVGAPKELNLESLRAPSVLKVEDLRSSDRRDSLAKPRSSRDERRVINIFYNYKCKKYLWIIPKFCNGIHILTY